MLQRDDLLRLARIIDYDRFVTPSLGMFSTPGFEYEYVQCSIKKWLDTGGYCITYQGWKKAIKGSASDPYLSNNEIKKRMQHNEIRTRKEMKTKELRTMLTTLPLRFKFDNGIDVVVLPKLPSDPHKVYVKWSTNRDLYCEQYSLHFESDLHKKWFNKERGHSTIGQDWRYLLQLNAMEDGTDELYKNFEGVYTGEVEFRLLKGTELYRKKFDIETKKSENRIKVKNTPRANNAAEEQKMVCIKDPKTGNIIRIAKFFTGKFIKNGFTFASKEEYKLQQKLKFEKRKDMAEGNLEAQLLKYTGKSRAENRGSKRKGIAKSPYERFQTITMETLDKKNKELIAQETIKIKRLIPQYEYTPKVWEIKKDGVVIETIPFLKPNGDPVMNKRFIENFEEWVTIIRDVPTKRKTIKVLQIPSKKMMNLKTSMSDVHFTKPKGASAVIPVIRSQRRRYLLSENKQGIQRWTDIYSDPTIK